MKERYTVATFIISGSRGYAVPWQIGAGDLVMGATIKGMPDYIKVVAGCERKVTC